MIKKRDEHQGQHEGNDPKVKKASRNQGCGTFAETGIQITMTQKNIRYLAALGWQQIVEHAVEHHYPKRSAKGMLRGMKNIISSRSSIYTLVGIGFSLIVIFFVAQYLNWALAIDRLTSANLAWG